MKGRISNGRRDREEGKEGRNEGKRGWRGKVGGKEKL